MSRFGRQRNAIKYFEFSVEQIGCLTDGLTGNTFSALQLPQLYLGNDVMIIIGVLYSSVQIEII